MGRGIKVGVHGRVERVAADDLVKMRRGICSRLDEWIKALGDGFVKLIKMAIAPIIFCTVVSGIAHISEVKKVGRVAVKALVYFEIVSTFALAIGLIVANVLHPGVGFSGQGNANAP